jgi:hypothetical protein
MRRRQVLRESRLAYVAVGASMLAIPASAAALVTSSSGASTKPGATADSSARASGGAAPRATVARVHVHPRAISALGGQAVTVRGRLTPALRWRHVRLEARDDGRWATVANSQTGNRGRFSVRYAPSGPGGQRLRVVVGGRRGTPSVSAPAGMLTIYRQSVASWYDDGGATACGFHAHYGVANRTLPCGSKVTFVHGGRRVTAVVDDRGPFVSGRDWDLNQNTAAALAFDGVESVWSSA